MIYSMTGYGIATQEIALLNHQGVASGRFVSVSVELRSVNSRFLDFHFRAPDECRSFEPQLREMLTKQLSRGKVECRINLQRTQSSSQAPTLDNAVLQQIQALEQQVVQSFPKAGNLRTGEILRWPGLIVEPELTPEALQAGLKSCAEAALKQLLLSRSREGEALKQVLLARAQDMLAIVAEITPLVPQLLTQHQQKLTERLTEALQAVGANGTTLMSKEEVGERIRQEVTVYGIRIDIAEEMARLQAHLNETAHMLEKGGHVGKRLDFMMQELNREANTLGSKAAAKELADASMALKLLIEQMREQVQNLE